MIAQRIIILLFFFIRHSFSTSSSSSSTSSSSSSENSNVNVDQWLNLSQYSSTIQSDKAKLDTALRSTASSSMKSTALTPAEIRNSADSQFNSYDHNLIQTSPHYHRLQTNRCISIESQASIRNNNLSLPPSWKSKGKRKIAVIGKKRSQEAKERYALNRKNERHRQKEMGIEMTFTQKQKIKIRKKKYWEKIKSDPELFAKHTEKRNARKQRRAEIIKADPKLNEHRKRVKREQMRRYRARLRARKNEEN